MYCSQCGQQIPDGSAFCPKCGARQQIQATPSQGNMQYAQQNVYQQPVQTASYYGKSIVVTDKKSFSNAVQAKYDTIIVQGPFAEEIGKQLKNNKAGDVASDAAIVWGLFFWPALIGGVVGKALTWEMKKYEISSVEENQVVVTRKKKK